MSDEERLVRALGMIDDLLKYINAVEANVKQFASDLEAQEYYCLAEEARNCLVVE